MNAQAERLRRLASREPAAGVPPLWRARTTVVASGKGGVGKSNLSLNLALALAAGGRRPLLVDADVGLGSIEVLAGVRLPLTLAHFLRGECGPLDVVEPGPGGVLLMGGGDALLDGEGFDRAAVARLLAGLAGLGAAVDHVLVDLPAGLGRAVRAWLAAAAEVVLVLVPEPTSLTDAYAVCKALARDNPGARLGVVVNRVDSPREGHEAFLRLEAACRRFLGLEPELLGLVPEDPALRRCVAEQRPLLLHAPLAPAALAVRRVAAGLAGTPPPAERAGLAGVLLRVAQRLRGEGRCAP